ncbi:MAG: hypothetical protein Q8Q59_13720 [Luteolibacter sp.]|jgi:hypothetical protein|nr:hypothetical protein [Luteolibacter sp.]
MARALADTSGTENTGIRRWLPIILIIAASALAHVWCLGSQFYLDDPTQIRDNEEIQAGMFWGGVSCLWTNFGYVIQCHLFGKSPVGYHAVNWLLHTAVACVLFGFGRVFTRGRAPAGTALFGAVLFAVHPLASEIPNYARTQDLAWVTLFSLLASWALLAFLRDGGRWKPVWVLLGIAGATISKGPGLFHALMMAGAVGLAFMTPAHWCLLRRRWWWLAGGFLLGFAVLWITGYFPRLLGAASLWAEPRIIGHGYTVARVFWEFAWRAVVPVSLSSDHHITETLMPPGASFWNIPDTGAIWAAAAMLALTALSVFLACRKSTRLLGVCLFLFTATMLFRVLYLIPEFMPEYRIYPGMPWFCLGAAIVLAALWRRFLGGVSPRFPAVVLILVFALMSAKRSFLWHDLDRLMADVLKQYPAQARAIWELHRRDAYLGDWQKIIDRQRREWPPVFRRFLGENSRLAPERALPTGHFALADVACAGLYAEALAHVEGRGPAMLELQRLEAHMRGLRMDPLEHKIHWTYYFRSKVRVLEQVGRHQAAMDLIRQEGEERFGKADIRRIKRKLGKGE